MNPLPPSEREWAKDFDALAYEMGYLGERKFLDSTANMKSFVCSVEDAAYQRGIAHAATMIKRGAREGGN